MLPVVGSGETSQVPHPVPAVQRMLRMLHNAGGKTGKPQSPGSTKAGKVFADSVHRGTECAELTEG